MSARPESYAPGARLSIGEVVSLLRSEFNDLTDSKIRFLEDRKLISPARTSGGYRSFGPHDIEVLRWILTRQRDQYLPLSIIGERIDRGEHLADIWGIGIHEAPGSSPAATAEPEPEAPSEFRAAGAAAATGAADAAEGPQEPVPADAVESATDPVSTAPTAGPKPPWIAPDAAATYSAAELSAESGLTVEEIAELTDFGLLVPLDEADEARSLPPQAEAAHAAAVQASLGLEPPAPRYSSGALLVARISREFATYGLQARHLRVVRNAAARDASMFEQGIQPILHAGGASADLDAQRSLGRLIALCERLRSHVMGEALRRYWR
ncbi:MerR family transcriptional regulator [Candidatus Poriferisodalis sp.]|uniref:MerR family transcriptional regulator n=1 Tax=Candidatus Poriferisodalis sp. TaxID=3101277 RepID=UPI003B0118FC